MIRRKRLPIQPVSPFYRYMLGPKPRRSVWQKIPKNRKERVKDFLVSFFRQNSIHGLIYLVKKGLSWFERCFWLILITGSLGFCVSVILQSFEHYETDSTVVSLERDYYYWRTKTAGVTICPMNRLNEDYFDDYCRLHNIEGQRKVEFFDFLENLANSTYSNFDRIPQHDSIDGILKELHVNPEDYMKLIYNLTGDPTLSEDPISLIYAHNGNVRIHVRQVLTEWGLCYNVNTVLGLENTAYYMLFGQIPENYRNTGMSYTATEGSFFDTDVSYQVFGFTSAIDMFTHSAYEVLKIDRPFGYSKLTIDVQVETKETTTEEDLQERTSVRQRNCRFDSESNLHHFPIYTRNLCLQECRLNLAYHVCKCIPHFYPNLVKNPKPVCSYKQLKQCFPDKRDHFLQIFRFHSKYDGFECVCLENCRDSHVYITHAFLMVTSEDLFGGLGVIVRMKKFPTFRLKRQQIFTFTDLLVSVGGTAGFFLGFSILGAIEILYYFSLRLFWFLRG